MPSLKTVATELPAPEAVDSGAWAAALASDRFPDLAQGVSTPETGSLLTGLGKLMQPVGDWFGATFGGQGGGSAPLTGTPAEADAAPDDAASAIAPDSDAPPRLVEMAHAAGAAYGDRNDPFMEGTAADWQPVQASALGLPEESDPGADAPWVFKDGIFTAEPQVGGRDAGEVALHVGEAEIDGQRTLMVAFRGTDNPGNVLADLADARVPTIKPVYGEALRPATDAILDYVADDANGVDLVLVTGHSLGGILAQDFMEQADPDLGTFQAATFGSSGINGAEVARDDRILHVELTQDPILNFIDRAEAVQDAAPSAAAPFLYDDRVLSGQTLVVDLQGEPTGDDRDDPLFAHRMPAYARSVEAVVDATPDAVPAEFLHGKAGAGDETAAPTLRVEDLGLTAGDDGTGLAAFRIALPAPSTEDTRIDYEVSGASAGTDWIYTDAAGSLDLPRGVTEATLEVEIAGPGTGTPGDALILRLSGAGDGVEHRFDLGGAPASEETPADDADDTDVDALPQVKAAEWTLHKEMSSWLVEMPDSLRDRAFAPDAARHLDLGEGRALRMIDLAEDAARDHEEDLPDLADFC